MDQAKARATTRTNPFPNFFSQADPSVVLAADVGGTNCRFVLSRLSPAALAAAAAGDDGFEADTLLAVTYPTKRHATFGDALAALEREPSFVPPAAAALAVAGPVTANRCAMTNLAWVIDGNALSTASGVPVAVLNDFEAAGYGVLALDHGSAAGGAPSATADIVPLTDAPPVPRGPKAVLGPGTGLGQAQLLWDSEDGAYRVWPSEGAHASWGGRGWKQRALSAAVEAQLGYCEVEHVACGVGLERIHAFLSSDQAAHRPGVVGMGSGAPLAAPAITAAALSAAAAADPPSPEDALALEAVDLFLAILGAEAGAMGLRALATGGVYLAGGITPRLIDRIARAGGLVDAFLWPASRFSTLLRTFPLYAVTNDGLGLLGSRVVASRALARKRQ
jgi:glucokinase